MSPAPRARRSDTRRELHGTRWDDPYAWMRDPNWMEVMKDPSVLDAEIRSHLEAENAHVEEVLADTTELRRTLVAEMRGRIREDDESVPTPDGPFEYYVRYRSGGQHPLFCRRPVDAPDRETILVDGDAESEGQAFFRITSCRHSPDHQHVAVACDVRGSEYVDLQVRRIDDGSRVGDPIPDTAGYAVWANDGASLFYARLDANHRPMQIYHHRLGTSPGEDRLVYEESDPGFFVSIGKTSSDRFIVINPHTHATDEVHLIDADAPQSPARCLMERDTGVEYRVDDDGERLIIVTNHGGAEDFKVVSCPPESPDPANWTDRVPHRAGTLITGLRAFSNHYVRSEVHDALPRIVVTDRSDGSEHVIAFDESVYDVSMHPGYEFDTGIVRITYSSMTTPRETYDYHMGTRSRSLRKRQSVPSGHAPADYRTDRVWATSHDGARVPISILHRADTPLDGSAPCLLTGYGSYGFPLSASFSTNRLSLVDRGFVVAIAHVRGGTELGKRWYLDSKGPKKTNTFHDFVACADALVDQSVAARGRITCQGGSAGGLLVGAAINLAPDRFRAAIAQVPFVDVLNTMCDASLPLTPLEYPEWGNPVTDPEAFAAILGYSPYDNVAEGPYPHVLATAGLTDPRVTYWEPAKWIARLRERRTDDGHSLLHVDMSAGHAGKAGRFEALDEVALTFAFVLQCEGLAG